MITYWEVKDTTKYILKYFDSGSTSFPKPNRVFERIREYLNEIGGPYGRSFYDRALKVTNIVEEVRDSLGAILGIRNAGKIFFSYNATYAANIILWGMEFISGKEVFVSGMEHNAIMRPLSAIAKVRNIKIKYLPSYADGSIDLSKIEDAITEESALVIVNHQSNVNGVRQDVAVIKKKIGDIPIFIDIAQSAGECKIDIDNWDVDYAVFTGHKGLLGPTGIGGGFIKDPDSLVPLFSGGTGSSSESFLQPDFMPDKFESGTPNIAGIFGLKGALESLKSSEHSDDDFFYLIDGIEKIGGYKVYRALCRNSQGRTFSITSDFASNSDLALYLNRKWRLEMRVGLHCAPLAHKTIGSYPEGTIRFSISKYHKRDDFDYLLKALEESKKHFLQ